MFPALPSWLRKPSPRTVDITVTVVVALLIVPGTVIDAAHHGKGLAAAVFTVAAVVPLLWRRRAMFVTLARITAATVLTPVDGPFAIPLLPWSARSCFSIRECRGAGAPITGRRPARPPSTGRIAAP